MNVQKSRNFRFWLSRLKSFENKRKDLRLTWGLFSFYPNKIPLMSDIPSSSLTCLRDR